MDVKAGVDGWAVLKQQLDIGYFPTKVDVHLKILRQIKWLNKNNYYGLKHHLLLKTTPSQYAYLNFDTSSNF